MDLTPAQWGLVLITAFILFKYLRIFLLFRTIALFAGILLLGTAGWLGHVGADIAGWVTSVTGSLATWGFGVSVAWIAVLVCAVMFLHGLHPQNQTKNHHAWWGAALAVLLIAGTAGSIPLLGHLQSDVRQGVVHAQQAVSRHAPAPAPSPSAARSPVRR